MIRPKPRVAHRGEHRLHRPQRSVEAHVEPGVEPRLVLVLEPAERAAAPRVVHEDVDRAPLGERALDHRARRRRVRRRRCGTAIAATPNSLVSDGGDRVAPVAVDLGDEHARAFRREPPRDAVADPVAGAGDDRDPILQPPAHRASSLSAAQNARHGRPVLGDGSHPVVVLGPVRGRQRQRVDARLGAVPEAVAAADEEPRRPVAGARRCRRRGSPGGSSARPSWISPLQYTDPVACSSSTRSTRASRRAGTCVAPRAATRRTARAAPPRPRVAPDLHVGDEQRDEVVEVARVERERVTRRELPDLLVRDEPFDRAHEIANVARCANGASVRPCPARSVTGDQPRRSAAPQRGEAQRHAQRAEQRDGEQRPCRASLHSQPCDDERPQAFEQVRDRVEPGDGVEPARELRARDVRRREEQEREEQQEGRVHRGRVAGLERDRVAEARRTRGSTARPARRTRRRRARPSRTARRSRTRARGSGIGQRHRDRRRRRPCGRAGSRAAGSASSAAGRGSRPGCRARAPARARCR